MHNHFHCILRSRHDVVGTWSDDEIALKWWMLCPARKAKDGSPAEPTEFELNSIRKNKREDIGAMHLMEGVWGVRMRSLGNSAVFFAFDGSDNDATSKSGGDLSGR